MPKVREIFYSIQGEGIHKEIPTVFIRLSGCQLLTPCNWCFLEGNVLLSNSRSNKDIRKLKTGDRLLAWDGGAIVETIVDKVLTRKVSNYREILVEGIPGKKSDILLRVTKDHPIMTTSGWKSAGELTLKDELYYLPWNSVASAKMRFANPMFDPKTVERCRENTDYAQVSRSLTGIVRSDETRKKLSEIAIAGNYGERLGKSNIGRTPSPMTEKARLALSHRMTVNNPMFNPETADRVSESSRGRTVVFTELHKKNLSLAMSAKPTRLFGESNPNWRGGIQDYGRWLSKLDREVVTDFLIERDGKICQKIYCKSTTDLTVHHIDFDFTNEDPNNMVLLCRKCNSSVNHGRFTLTLKSGRVCAKLENGLTILDIEDVEKEVEVFNLSCSPINNFFIDGILCHNCDTPYARDFNVGEDMTLDEITARVSTLAPYYDQWVCITGGEPLANPDQLRELVKKLKEGKYRTEVFTNGSIPKPLWWTLIDSWVVDIKCPGSGICGVSLIDSWFSVRPDDQIKFVVQDEVDLNFVTTVLKNRATLPGRPIVLISPMIPLGDSAGIINNPWIQRVVEFTKELNRTYRPVRLSLQLHKVLYGDRIGV